MPAVRLNTFGGSARLRGVEFDEFLREQLGPLVRFAGVLTADTHLAQDIVQDALVRAHARWGRIGRMDRPDLYLRRMITNGYLSWRRLAAVRTTRPVADAGRLDRATSPDPAAHLVDRDQVRTLLATLSRRQRAVLVLRFYEGRSDEEIAAILGCATGTVRSHVSRALADLRKRVHRDQPIGITLEVSES
jgi:RNA polymerase sigma-70 factor (sigma-E family)